MGDEIPEWQTMWGAKVKMPIDMADDMLKDAITTAQKALDECSNFEADGLEVAESIKKEFDERWEPSWHVFVGRNFGSFVTHETRKFLYFYVEDKAVMLFKAG
mmetsp:Transcript_59582/g.119605  ORF Transcript_59582/g.119605 Transcript_59582/m.119605 type:complete len:103 (-) Transcript_59582:308-616(-)